jgi:hypothetical protein
MNQPIKPGRVNQQDCQLKGNVRIPRSAPMSLVSTRSSTGYSGKKNSSIHIIQRFRICSLPEGLIAPDALFIHYSNQAVRIEPPFPE